MLVSTARQELRVCRGDLLLDLQEHGVVRPVPFEQHHVIPQPNALSSAQLAPRVEDRRAVSAAARTLLCAVFICAKAGAEQVEHAHLAIRQIFSTGIAVPAGFWVYSERFLEHEHGELSINDREFTLLIRP